MTDDGRVRPAGHAGDLAAGERVMLVDRKERHYLVTLEDGGEWHSHAGVLAHDDVIGAREGSEVRTSRNMALVVLRPTREDYVLKMRRGAQVVYPKDQAMIVALGDVRPGCTVVEAGAGSGALSLALLDAVRPGGHLISFERREDHLDDARRNVIGFYGESPPHWDLRHGDVAEALADIPCDRVVLDLVDPWRLVGSAGDALRPGGILVTYTPTVPQVMRLSDALIADGRFARVRTVESLLRGWNVDGLSVRPNHRMVAHTAFLTVARRVPTSALGGPGRDRSAPSGIAWTDG